MLFLLLFAARDAGVSLFRFACPPRRACVSSVSPMSTVLPCVLLLVGVVNRLEVREDQSYMEGRPLECDISRGRISAELSAIVKSSRVKSCHFLT